MYVPKVLLLLFYSVQLMLVCGSNQKQNKQTKDSIKASHKLIKKIV